MSQRHFGLIGKKLSHSFSKNYFTQKFDREDIKDCFYHLYELPEISGFPSLLLKDGLVGLNVTIPYKEEVMPYLDSLNECANRIGAVNVIKVSRTTKGVHTKGYNTDYIGFKHSLAPMLQGEQGLKALILGTGGASKAVAAALEDLKIGYVFVSRKPAANELSYHDITPDVLRRHRVVINTTPLGMYPDVASSPELPYEAITSHHVFYDLVYNPMQTMFLQKAAQHGAKTQNGLDMLHMQAEEAWAIWNR